MKQTIGSLFNAVGQPMTVVKVRTFQLVVMIAGMYLIGKRMGIAGVALAVDLMLVLGIVIALILARKYVDYSLKDMFLWPTLAVGAGMAIALGVRSLLPEISSQVLSAAVDFVLFTIGYGAVLLLFDRQNTSDLIFLLDKYLLPKKLPKRLENRIAAWRSIS
jgi:O-antigen/teichoic acid export membrane protein